MKRYDTLELSDPETYLSDDQLATAARAVATIYFKDVFSKTMGRGAAKKAVLNGKYPHLVKQYIDGLCANHAAATKQTEENTDIIKTIIPPRDYSINIVRSNICIYGPYDNNLAQRVKRQNGHWGSASTGAPRDCWIIPLNKAKSIKKILANWEKLKDAEKKQRWKLEEKHAAEKAKHGRKRDADRRTEELRKRKAKASRVKVFVNKYQVGDELRGRKIKSFGSYWTETSTEYKQVDDAPEMKGQLWEPCQCGDEPVYLPLHLCEKCWPGAERVATDPVAVCYAYFE